MVVMRVRRGWGDRGVRTLKISKGIKI